MAKLPQPLHGDNVIIWGRHRRPDRRTRRRRGRWRLKFLAASTRRLEAIPFAIAAFILCVVLAGLHGFDVGGLTTSGHTIQGYAQVIDGDTLALGRQRIRLKGIDAPESGQFCGDAGGRAYACGAVATSALRAKIARRAVKCDGSDRDRYGRLLATCSVGGDDLGAWLVSGGFALANYRYTWRYAGHEAVARTAGRGMWAGAFERPADWRARS